MANKNNSNPKTKKVHINALDKEKAIIVYISLARRYKEHRENITCSVFIKTWLDMFECDKFNCSKEDKQTIREMHIASFGFVKNELDGKSYEEIIAFNKDQEKLYNAVYTLTKENIVTMDNIDIVCPTGIAIQNARKVFDKLLTRDGYHLSLDVGRFIASLTLYKAITNKLIDKLDCLVENIDINDKNKIIDVVNNSSFK